MAGKKKATTTSKAASSGIPRDSYGRPLPTEPPIDATKRAPPAAPDSGVRDSQAPAKKAKVGTDAVARSLFRSTASVDEPMPQHVEKALDNMLEPFGPN